LTDHDAKAIPVLASLDIAASKAFYVDQLGFAELVYEDAAYLILRRGPLELHFWLAQDKIYPEHTSCYIRGGEIEALYREFVARGVPRLSPFTVQPWRMKEFHLHDLHGNLLRFGCVPNDEGRP
jgi:catechol 2,3-dioxygenase-like lactoylglutathione lyase family enzyme